MCLVPVRFRFIDSSLFIMVIAEDQRILLT